MISCFREWLTPSGDSSSWPTLSIERYLPVGLAVRWYSTGRAALYQAIEPLARNSPGTALLPAYIAAGVIDPLRALGYAIRFYGTGCSLLPDVNTLAETVTTDPSLRILVILHPMGRVQDLGELPGVCRSQGVVLVEDCAQALFCSDPFGRPAGCQGDLALFSLTKHLGCVDGAAVVYRNDTLPLPEQSRRRPLPTRVAAGWYGMHLLLNRAMHRSANPDWGKQLLDATGFCYERFYSNVSSDFRPLAPSSISTRQLNALDVPVLISQRRKNISSLYAGLRSSCLRLVYPEDHQGWVAMAVPALVERDSRTDVVARAMKRNVFLASLCDRWNFLPSEENFRREKDYLDRHVLIPINEHINDQRMASLVDVLNAL